MNLEPCIARDVVNRLSSRYRQEKHELVRFLIELADFDRSQLWLELGFPSLLGCLMDALGMTESSACRRIGAARLVARFPAIEGYLATGRLTLMGLMALKDVLREDNAAALLERAAGLSEPAVRELVTRLRFEAARPAPMDAAPEPATSTMTATSDATPAAPLALTPAPPATEQSEMKLWVDQSFRDLLAAVRDLLSHAVPSGKLEDVLQYALREVRKRHETRRYGAKQPRAAAATAATEAQGRCIPAAIRREVAASHERSCDFRGVDGHRCGSTTRLEHQHIDPVGKGGPSVASNLTYLCGRHNRLQAERDFGKQAIAARIAAKTPPPRSPHADDAESALVNLGFTRRQATGALARASVTGDLPTLIRECLRILVPVGRPRTG